MVLEKFIFQYDRYDSATGVLYEVENNMVVKFSVSNNECTISANREGLLSLAKSLIKLADNNVPEGAHYHLDAGVFLEESSVDVVIEKI
ncbi:MAG: hypothetical protein OEV59_04150 [Deltaproteobacteria bacterium]|nr:hypothetical protein [Deltaproteobacteria bacterium]